MNKIFTKSNAIKTFTTIDNFIKLIHKKKETLLNVLVVLNLVISIRVGLLLHQCLLLIANGDITFVLLRLDARYAYIYTFLFVILVIISIGIGILAVNEPRHTFKSISKIIINNIIRYIAIMPMLLFLLVSLAEIEDVNPILASNVVFTLVLFIVVEFTRKGLNKLSLNSKENKEK